MQNVIKLSAAVHELSCEQKNNNQKYLATMLKTIVLLSSPLRGRKVKSLLIRIATFCVILRLHDQANIEQTSSWLAQLTRASSSSQFHRVNGVLVAVISLMLSIAYRL